MKSTLFKAINNLFHLYQKPFIKFYETTATKLNKLQRRPLGILCAMLCITPFRSFFIICLFRIEVTYASVHGAKRMAGPSQWPSG
jgi:hypothetical protein